MATTDIHHIVGSLKPARAALRFLGGATDDAVQVDVFAAARVTADDTAGSFTAWIMPVDITGDYAIISCGDASAIEYITLSIKAGKLRIQCFDATVEQYDHASTAVVVTPHKWMHVAVVQNASVGASNFPRLYVNGELVATTMADETDNGTWFDDCALIDGGSFGAAEEDGAGNLTKEFKGAISDVKYWPVELTAEQIKKDYQNQNPDTIHLTTLVSDLTDHWDFKTMNAVAVTDVITAANNGTIVGDCTKAHAYSEFTSRLYDVATPIVDEDNVSLAVDDETGHCIVIKAA